uniref:Uncharacterized protein n=1 Tax=Anopheles atroparvus TaxID=41427 RepID=A0AAG5DQR7_ANOAO
ECFSCAQSRKAQSDHGDSAHSAQRPHKTRPVRPEKRPAARVRCAQRADGHEDHLEGEEGHSLTRAAEHQHPAGVRGSREGEREGPMADRGEGAAVQGLGAAVRGAEVADGLHQGESGVRPVFLMTMRTVYQHRKCSDSTTPQMTCWMMI